MNASSRVSIEYLFFLKISIVLIIVLLNSPSCSVGPSNYLIILVNLKGINSG